MSISAITDKDTFHREVSVLPQARISSTERYQCHPEQGYFHREVSVPSRARILPQRGISAISSRDASTEASVPLLARMLSQRHQCYPLTILGQGCSDQEHQCSISIGMLILLNNVWMTPDVVPTRTIHHRFLILKKPSNLTMYLCPWCKDKSTWRRSVVYIVETGITVFEVN